MKRIKTARVQKLIQDCRYWGSMGDYELLNESIKTLINEAGDDHPLVQEYLKNYSKIK